MIRLEIRLDRFWCLWLKVNFWWHFPAKLHLVVRMAALSLILGVDMRNRLKRLKSVFVSTGHSLKDGRSSCSSAHVNHAGSVVWLSFCVMPNQCQSKLSTFALKQLQNFFLRRCALFAFWRPGLWSLSCLTLLDAACTVLQKSELLVKFACIFSFLQNGLVETLNLRL